ncbi:DUF29 family protein [Nostoc sp. CHAB 5715]|uniref:DUF29 family protein n=1 Tax=Nostoc sp. CHAB 5715 TaxID=2780400 RepID=UPI001E6561D6|nr:DUF29 family protein [Nostoc sp. CHAB 5715]MCC5623792.1 DUF29 domain-containing protein [Nostoc sp. CHAB 5715]
MSESLRQEEHWLKTITRLFQGLHLPLHSLCRILLPVKEGCTTLSTTGASLKSYPEEVLAQCYHRGLKAASNETELPIDTFPVECPYSIAQILDAEFLPDAIDL